MNSQHVSDNNFRAIIGFTRRLMVRLTVALLVVAVAGCGGWYPRGAGPKPAGFSRVFISASNAENVDRALRTELKNRGVVISSRADAELVIDVDSEQYDRRILSIDPSTGKVREVEVALRTYFSVRTGDGKLVIPREAINWQLDYVFDEISVLGTVEQDAIMRIDLAETAATAVALRLQAVDLDNGDP